jgi:hypothetical protein
MSLVDELKELIARTGSYNDRDLLERILYLLSRQPKNNWGAEEIYMRNRK